MHRVDLSGPIHHGMWTYGPPLPEVQIFQAASLDKHGWDAHGIHGPLLLGTSIETAGHLLPDQPTLEDLPLDTFFVRAAVFQLPELEPRASITVAHLEAAGVSPEPGDAILIATGWDRMWHEPRFYWDSPHFTRESMQWVVDRQPSILGVDLASNSDPHGNEGLNLLLFATGALLLGPLYGLRNVKSSYVDLIALPLKVSGTTGAPCRVVAVEV